MSRRSFIQVQSKVSWWGFNIFCIGVNVQNSTPRLKHLIEWGEMDWYEFISWHYVIMSVYLVTGFCTGLNSVMEGKSCVIYILKFSWWQNSAKSSWADSFIRWFKPADILETDCLSIGRVLNPDFNDLSWLLAWEGFLDSISEDEFSCNCYAGMSRYEHFLTALSIGHKMCRFWVYLRYCTEQTALFHSFNMTLLLNNPRLQY